MMLIFDYKEAVQQSKIGRKRKANRALNPKRSEIFSAKSNCGTASKVLYKLLFVGILNCGTAPEEWGIHEMKGRAVG